MPLSFENRPVRSRDLKGRNPPLTTNRGSPEVAIRVKKAARLTETQSGYAILCSAPILSFSLFQVFHMIPSFQQITQQSSTLFAFAVRVVTVARYWLRLARLGRRDSAPLSCRGAHHKHNNTQASSDHRGSADKLTGVGAGRTGDSGLRPRAPRWPPRLSAAQSGRHTKTPCSRASAT